MLDQPHYHVSVSTTGTGPSIDMSGCGCPTCRVPPPITFTSTGFPPIDGLSGGQTIAGGEDVLVQPVTEPGRPANPLYGEPVAVDAKRSLLKAAAQKLEAAADQRQRSYDLIESIADRVDEALIRQEVIEDKIDAILSDHEELDTLKAKVVGWAPPVVGDRVWSRATHEGPLYVVRTVVTSVTATPSDRDQSAPNKFTGVDACVVRDESGRFQTIPVGDLSHEAPERQPIPGRVYAAMIAAGVLTTIIGHLVGLFLVR